MQKPVNLGTLDNPMDIARLQHYIQELYSLINFVRTGTTSPAFTPSKIGDVYIDTAAKKVYIATGSASSTSWTVVN